METSRNATISAVKPKNFPRDSNFNSSGVFGVSEPAISLAILPSWVFIPVVTTTPIALPEATHVPINAIFFLSANRVLSSNCSGFLRTVIDSPVSADSSILH